MSDGGGQSGKQAETNSNYNHIHIKKKKKRSGIDDFAHAITRVSVAQICESAGFQGFQQSALNTLSDIGVRYIREIGRTSNSYANLACRSQCNVFDVIQGLEDLCSLQGFLGASDVHRCLTGSGTVREIVRYVGGAEEIPFAYSIPGFPVAKDRKQDPSYLQTGESPPGEHIPSWLPAFPDPGTCSNVHAGDEKATETRVDETDQVGKRRGADSALVNLQQQMTCNGSESTVAVDIGDASKGKGSGVSNPFLVQPMQFGEKEVSPVLLPPKLSDEAFVQHLNYAFVNNHVSTLETFVPVIEAVKSAPSNSEDGRKEVPLNGRPTVQFKFGRSKKSFHMATSSKREDAEIIASWFGDENEKDDKKRRAEQIL